MNILQRVDMGLLRYAAIINICSNILANFRHMQQKGESCESIMAFWSNIGHQNNASGFATLINNSKHLEVLKESCNIWNQMMFPLLRKHTGEKKYCYINFNNQINIHSSLKYKTYRNIVTIDINISILIPTSSTIYRTVFC